LTAEPTAPAQGRLDANGLSFVIDEAGAGDSVALCLHGFPESRYSWRHQLPLLAGLGWRAIAPDLRGYGQSSRPPDVADYRIEALIEDVAGMFEAAGARRRLLVGHDWGGVIAWAFAMRRRLPLDGLVVMNAPHPVAFRRAIQRSWRQKLRSWYMAFFQIPRLPEALFLARRAAAIDLAFAGFPAEVRQIYRRGALIPGAMSAMINYYRANIPRGPGGGEAASGAALRIETPTLLVWGEADRYLGPEVTEGYEPLAADLTFARLPGVSHWVQQEAPEAVNAALRGWLEARGLARHKVNND
jgi:pimeloyl-ACP methyl ester carboxylesterase